MDDLAPFESPKLLLDGAKTSIDNFKTRCDAFIDNCTYDVIEQRDTKTGHKVFKLRFHHRIPPAMRVPASQIVNDLRHTLDQAVCDASILLGRPHARGVYFPFGKTPDELKNEIANRCKNVHPELVTFIRAFNSHYGGDDMLYALGSLAGPNKHQRILRISLGGGGWEFLGGSIRTGDVGGHLTIGSSIWNDLRNEVEFARIDGGAQGNLQVRPIFQIVLGTGEPPLTDPAPTALSAFASKVESILLGIEAETARIKAAHGI